jgi:iron only hydrogenase large subunit-like protein
VDGLTGLEKLRAALASGKKYNLVEVMTCPGGCVHGAGLPFTSSREDIKNRAKIVYQADETEAINLPCKSPVCINLYEKLIKENSEIADKNIFHTHFEKRNVLL